MCLQAPASTQIFLPTRSCPTHHCTTASTLYKSRHVRICTRATPSPFFFFNDPAPTEIYTLSLPAALPISKKLHAEAHCSRSCTERPVPPQNTGSSGWSTPCSAAKKLGISFTPFDFLRRCSTARRSGPTKCGGAEQPNHPAGRREDKSGGDPGPPGGRAG